MKLRKSKWVFNTSASAGGGYAFVTAGVGRLWFKSDKGAQVVYNYGSAGGSVGKTLFKTSGSLSPAAMPNSGDVYMLDAFTADDLSPDDLTGLCTITDITIAGAGSIYFTVMILGFEASDVADELGIGYKNMWFGGPAMGWFVRRILEGLADDLDFDWPNFLKSSAKALLVIKGLTTASPGVSLSKSLGYISLPGDGVQIPPPNPTVANTTEGSGDAPGIRTSSQGKEDGPPIVLPGDALFKFDHYDLQPEAAGALAAAQAQIQKYPDRPILIEGYTDSFGSRPYNMTLSQNRADTVRKWLSDNKVANEIYTVGYGKDYPKATNKMAEGRRLNRRVEIHIMQPDWSPPSWRARLRNAVSG